MFETRPVGAILSYKQDLLQTLITLVNTMALSRRDLKTGTAAMIFDPDAFGAALRDECAVVDFALLMGSARNGNVPPGGDIDLALGMRFPLTLDLLDRITKIADRFAPGVAVDIGHFDRAEPVYRFEALKGRLLFARDTDRFLDAYSLTCREYESQIVDYERQTRYRLHRQEVAV